MYPENKKTTSIPLITENRLKSCLYVLGTNQPCSTNFFLKFDTNGSDYRIFFNRLLLIKIQKEDIKKKEITLTEEGQILYNYLHDEKNFKVQFHELLLRHLNHYKMFFEAAKKIRFTDIAKKEFFKILKEDLIKSGEDLSRPSYNSIISIGQCAKTIKIERGILKFLFKFSESDFIEHFQYLILTYVQKQQFSNNIYVREFSDLLEFIKSHHSINNEKYKTEFLINFLVNHQKELQISFLPGIGKDNIPSQYALVDLGEYFK